MNEVYVRVESKVYQNNLFYQSVLL